MSIIKRPGTFILLASGLSFGGSWRGTLVDLRCFESEEHNVNPGDSLTYVDRNRSWEIRFCAPRLKSKSFAFVDADGLSFRLDPDGNRKAAELVRKIGKRDCSRSWSTEKRTGTSLWWIPLRRPISSFARNGNQKGRKRSRSRA
jgi:hypothetical protein